MRGLLAVNLAVFCAAVLSGCASQQDLFLVKKDLISLRDISTSDYRNLDKRVKAVEDKSRDLDADLKRKQADLEADQKNIFLEVQSIKGMIEESEVKNKKISPEMEQMRKNLTLLVQSLGERLSELEKRVYASKGTTPEKEAMPSQPVQNDKDAQTAAPEAKGSQENPVPVEENKPSDEEMYYKDAYKEYLQGEYDNAREKFKKYLELYSASNNAGNAQYWIGECFYSQKKYEEAIVEYFEVIKKYPKGSKVSAAYLKQGMSFVELGGKENKENARNSFQKVIKEFPDSIEAKIASEKIAQIK